MEVIKNGELLEHPKVTLATTQLERVIVNAENNVNDSPKKEEKMDNQQQSILEEKIKFLAKNATIGDGTLWKHPEVNNYKVIYTSTSRELLEAKMAIAPKLFPSGVKFFETSRHKGRFANAKPMYRLASITHPIFTQVKEGGLDCVIDELTVEDIALWYLDDGSLVKRKDYDGYRVSISIGNCANTKERKDRLENKLKELFGDKFGYIQKNNSKATENNKTWYIPLPIARKIMPYAEKYKALDYKILR